MKYLIACPGPSLTKEDIEYGKGKTDKLILVNGANALYPISDSNITRYSSDAKWVRMYKHYDNIVCPFETEVTSERVDSERGRGFSTTVLRLGHCSGFAAVSLALLSGAKEIYLLGYDMGIIDNQAHFFGDYPETLHKKSPYEKFIEDFEVSKQDLSLFGATIFNCTIGSKLITFPISNIRDVL